MPTLPRLRVPFLLVLLSSTALQVQAQDEPATSLRDGAWALQFGVGSSFTLRSFDGSTISAKHHFSDRSALRYGLTLRASMDEDVRDDGQTSDGEPPASNSHHTEQRSNSQGLRLSVVYLRYPDVRRRTSDVLQLYWGVGPLVEFDRNWRRSRDSTHNVMDTNDIAEQQTGRTVSLTLSTGIEGLIGVEWFVRPRISLTAEYSSDLLYSRTLNRDRMRSERQPNPSYRASHRISSHGFSLSPRGVRFGISVYVRPGE